MVSPKSTLYSVLALLAALPSVFATTERGLAWATDNRMAPLMLENKSPDLTWYHHWQDGPVSQLDKKLEYVPMFWGTSKWGLWNARKAEMQKNTPDHLFGFNEPDIHSQGNMDPVYAAQVWMAEIHPWAAKGVKLGSPAIAYDLAWMDKFLNEIEKRGGHVDFICVHWYGSWKALGEFKKFIKAAHQRWGYNIWVTELGITTGSWPSQSQTKQFMIDSFNWMDSTGYVERASWFGCFQTSSPPDGYATGMNALFQTSSRLSTMGAWYRTSSSSSSRRELQARHHSIAARLESSNEETENPDAEHCDAICQLREAQYGPDDDDDEEEA
ncbi:glycosyl hydrolase catalytic core-domain-containing protein [Mycena floridula]|nr:glycosyl hydrolase catalytic core-domain-containing protein [Mycena floridula]